MTPLSLGTMLSIAPPPPHPEKLEKRTAFAQHIFLNSDAVGRITINQDNVYTM